MKTYLFDTINRYKRFSESLDVRTTLCNKSWWVFNDSGVKSLYIFQDNGDLYITTNGVGIRGTWQYIAANKTVIINSENTVLMLHPSFIDENILTLTLDGTNNCAFLIDENNKANFSPKSLSDLTRYFQEKEQKEIEARQEEERREQERQYQEQQRLIEEEKYKASPEYQKKLKEEQYAREAQELNDSLFSDSDLRAFVISLIFKIGCVGLLCLILFRNWNSIGLPLLLIILVFFLVFMGTGIAYYIEKSINNYKRNKWKKAHPDDPRSKYL